MSDFADFLDAKFDLDERSLAREVRDECFAAIAGRRRLRCCDVGTGTGAMVRRVLDAARGAAAIEIDAIDRDDGLLARALEQLRAHLARHGCTTTQVESVGSGSGSGAWSEDRGTEPATADIECCPAPTTRRIEALQEDRLAAPQARRRITVRLLRTDAARFEPAAGERYDLVTAHAFMDLVPMRPLLDRFAAWLAPGGLFYATLNYDGQTTLLPSYADAGFEAELLRRYDASMEARRVAGEPTGGAHSGRRLYAMLPEAGFKIVACASSDWNALPHRGRLRPGDRFVVAVLLDAIRRENQAHGEADRVAAWWHDRRTRLEMGTLGAIVHQIDILALRR